MRTTRPSKRRTRDARRSAAARGGSVARAASPAPLSVVILAAGEGKRMKSPLPKVLQPLAGRPLLKHVIDTARALGPAAIRVVYGHGGEQVRAALKDEPVSWTLQAERLGTGHAVLQAMQHIPTDTWCWCSTETCRSSVVPSSPSWWGSRDRGA